MPASIKIFSCKTVAVKLAFAAERPFSFFIPVYHTSYQFDALYGKRIIHQAFRITRFYFIFQQFQLRHIDEGGVQLIEYFHAVGKDMAQEAQAVLEEIVV